jgi:UDP-N-acetylglucosamine 2-epimerase (non-hydrolysing)
VARQGSDQVAKVLTIFGTRPEVIKLAPVIHELEARPFAFQTVNISSSQHTDILYPFVKLFGLRVDHDLQVMRANQTPNGVCARVLSALDPILTEEKPDLILVQGDTTTAMASALAGFHRRIPVGHVEAGLRSGNSLSPYPEEMNRRVITRLAAYHFAATPHNRKNLLAEGVEADSIFVTGNPVVDALNSILSEATVPPEAEKLLLATRGKKRIILTTHRRENFGEAMADNLRVLRRFVEAHQDSALIFPVHPNPAVGNVARAILSGHPRIHLTGPLDYLEFIVLLSHAWLIASDSGGVQEEAPTLGKPLLILRENTERPEALESGVARLVGGSAEVLHSMLEEAWLEGSWAANIARVENPFGRGDSGKRIADSILKALGTPAGDVLPAGQAGRL